MYMCTGHMQIPYHLIWETETFSRGGVCVGPWCLYLVHTKWQLYIWRNNGLKLFKFDENLNLPIKKCSGPQAGQHKDQYPDTAWAHCWTGVKEPILKPEREEGLIRSREKKVTIRLTLDFSSETMEARHWWNFQKNKGEEVTIEDPVSCRAVLFILDLALWYIEVFLLIVMTSSLSICKFHCLLLWHHIPRHHC